MYHSRFKGNHYEIGFRWGSLLLSHQNNILNHIPFPIAEERIDFAARCLPIYEKFFPEILEEIRGLADGQKCSHTKLRAFLLSMYAIPPSCNCSCFAVSNDNHILLGRNSDFLTEMEKQTMNAIYRFSSDSYDFTGNTTAFIQIEDGINENGLAIGLTSVYPQTIKPGINAGLLLRFFLEKCKSTEEVIHWVHELPICSAQTFTVADTSGDIAVLECCADKIQVLRPDKSKQYVCATNIFHSPALEHLNPTGIDTWESEQRYQTMEYLLKNPISKGISEISANANIVIVYFFLLLV